MQDTLISMAIQIADDAARSDIECHCAARMEDGSEPQRTEDHTKCWYDSLTISDPEMQATVRTALIYLCARGMIKWHARNRGWVRPMNLEPSTAWHILQ